MNAQQLLDFFEQKDITLRVADGHVSYRAPRGAVPADVVELLRREKSDRWPRPPG